MTPTQVPAVPGTRAPRRHRKNWLPTALAVCSAAAFGVFFLLPYYVNDLNQFALEEVAGGMHDPKDLWPFNQGAVGDVFTLGAYLTMAFSPFIAAVTAGWAGFDLWRSHELHDMRRTMLGILTVAFAAVTWVWLLSPLGTALIGWMLD